MIFNRLICSALITSIAVLTDAVHASQPIANYRSTIGVQALLPQGDRVWVASTGGLFEYNDATKRGVLHAQSRDFPDLELTALITDSSGALWIGTRQGYLYRRSPTGQQTVYTAYASAGWPITSVKIYGRYLLIGSDKGCSVFDMVQRLALKNASRFSTFKSSKVNALEVWRDTLFLGSDEGISKLYIAGDWLRMANFYDPSIWQITPLSKPVISFVNYGIVLKSQTVVSNLFHGHRYIANGKDVINDIGETVHTADGIITCLASQQNGPLWIGTPEHYFSRWSTQGVEKITIPGPNFTDARRVFVDSYGLVWVMPAMTDWPTTWWQGFAQFDGASWRRFNQFTDPKIGALGDSPNQRGIAEDAAGNMWFGCSGGNIKFFNRAKQEWDAYCIMATGGTYNEIVPERSKFQPAPCPSNWGKCDAIARDSSQFMWFSSWRNAYGSLVCYDTRALPNPAVSDPVEAHYRRFFPLEDETHIKNTSLIYVNPQGMIFACSDADEEGKIVIFTHNGNPLANGVSVYARLKGFGEIYDMVTTPDDTTWMATSKGIFQYNNRGSFDAVPGLEMSCKAIKIEDNNHWWIATASSGLMYYDRTQYTQRYISRDNGLISNTINDMFLDKKKGCIWVATDQGVSRVDLGYVFDKPTAGSAKSIAYPNPFSLSAGASRGVLITQVPSDATVSIYSSNGAFLATAPSTSMPSAFGKICEWKPGVTTQPGTYVYVVGGKTRKTVGKVLVVP